MSRPLLFRAKQGPSERTPQLAEHRVFRTAGQRALLPPQRPLISPGTMRSQTLQQFTGNSLHEIAGHPQSVWMGAPWRITARMTGTLRAPPSWLGTVSALIEHLVCPTTMTTSEALLQRLTKESLFQFLLWRCLREKSDNGTKIRPHLV